MTTGWWTSSKTAAWRQHQRQPSCRYQHQRHKESDRRLQQQRRRQQIRKQHSRRGLTHLISIRQLQTSRWQQHHRLSLTEHHFCHQQRERSRTTSRKAVHQSSIGQQNNKQHRSGLRRQQNHPPQGWEFQQWRWRRRKEKQYRQCPTRTKKK